MLRIALLITGTTRNYQDNYITWKKHLLDLYHVDIFFHTYDISGYHNDIYGNRNVIFNQKPIVDLLNPQKYIIDSFVKKIAEFRKLVVSQCVRPNSPKPEFIKAQMYSIFKANELKTLYEKENGLEYDIVIKIRFDTIFYSQFPIEDVKMIYSYNNIILCGNPNIKAMKFKNACLKCVSNFDKLLNVKCKNHDNTSDIVFISKSHIMNYYANIYNKYDEYISIPKNMDLSTYVSHTYENKAKLYNNVPKGMCPYPERVLALYLQDYILLNYSMNLDINRNIKK